MCCERPVSFTQAAYTPYPAYDRISGSRSHSIPNGVISLFAHYGAKPGDRLDFEPDPQRPFRRDEQTGQCSCGVVVTVHASPTTAGRSEQHQQVANAAAPRPAHTAAPSTSGRAEQPVSGASNLARPSRALSWFSRRCLALRTAQQPRNEQPRGPSEAGWLILKGESNLNLHVRQQRRRSVEQRG